ncbi:unnamed protein product [Dracunculus medinensis]|uniref:Alpha-type protein kinase domain-containing protein n=1 Tax=Dracunculus medinensis TaxID=318479 RepID=A0A0N4UQJ5_DRAME|nr:unnamed protein product [Dracunculus medinensis]
MKKKFSKSCEHIENKNVNINKKLENFSDEPAKKLLIKWRNIARNAVFMKDPWSRFGFDDLPVENCLRYRYSSIRKQWTQDRVQVKLHPEPFAHGAMRECYRLKKLSNATNNDWTHAQNYVAKKYINEVKRQTVFEDVKLQMDSKLWAEEYNRYNPPKKIDIFQVSILEFMERNGSPLYQLEHFIEGKYVKYNSNSGFVSDIVRNTPQAFSHFTFERSGHQLIVVDIQGVGDLYTDPQIHTANGTEYGDGNLGTKGMALFFHSHICNEICDHLGLTEFDLSPNEKKALQKRTFFDKKTSCATRLVCSDKIDVCSPIIYAYEDNAMERLRIRTQSMNSMGRQSTVSSICDSSSLDDNCLAGDYSTSGLIGDISLLENDVVDDHIVQNSPLNVYANLHSASTGDSEKEKYWVEARKMSRPAGLLNEIQRRDLRNHFQLVHHHSILGQIHLDLARYHELGRFIYKSLSVSANEENFNNEKTNINGITENLCEYDKESALFHLEIAQRCGILEAIKTIAEMAYGLPHELLKEVGNEYRNIENREEYGLELMKRAADSGDVGAMIFVAEAYETGRNLGKNNCPCWPKAIDFYNQAAHYETELEVNSCIGSTSFAMPHYEILSKMADMFKEGLHKPIFKNYFIGGYGLERDLSRAYELYNEAAEKAMESMKGKLATKLYELAEQCA